MIINDHRAEALAMLERAIERALTKSGEDVSGAAKDICPVDTGNLRNSIEVSPVQDNTVEIGTNVEYAIYVEMGTSRMKAKPYLGPAIKGKEQAIIDNFKKEIQLMR